MHFCYHLDGVTVSVNHFYRVRYVDLKYDYGFVVSITSMVSMLYLCNVWLIVYFIGLFILSPSLFVPIAGSSCRSSAIPGMQMKQGMSLMAERLMGAASLLSLQKG
jgi:hypothetical protein